MRDENQAVWITEAEGPYDPRPALTSDLVADVAIVGGGLTGVSTAYCLSERFPDRRVVLLEARTLAHGASGRNGGLALNWTNAETSEPESVRRGFAATQRGLAIIAERIQRHRLPVDLRRGYYEVYTRAQGAEYAHARVESMRALGVPLRFLSGAELASHLRLEGVAGAIFDPTAGRINSAAYLRALRPVLLERGVEIYEDTPVTALREGRPITIETPGGAVRADTAVLATNAYTPALGYFRDRLIPLQAHVIATEPRSPDEWRALGWSDAGGFSDDRDRVAYGSMSAGGRLVFGGGSNAAYGYLYGSRPYAAKAATEASWAALRRCLGEYLPQAAELPQPSRWTGPVALTLDRVCSMGVRGEHRNLLYALGYSGHGVTLANLAGEVLTDLYSDAPERWRDQPFFQRKMRLIPPEPFRWLGYQAWTRLTGRSPRRALK